MRMVRRTHEQTDSIDLTPMLDVVFIMLIFFVVTASFIKERVVPINQTPLNSESSGTSSSSVITVTHDNKIIVDDRRVEVLTLRSLMSQKASINGVATSFVVNAHEQSSTEMYVAILDAAYQSNIYAVSLKTYESK